ncbi:hypothetical protein EDD65_107148 [Keratinibaculum paraultunense]|uniref:Uncharacterized protein n=1 Tax=Keratinibaculum paraultunense TaxID=1278232 RepID=A0A4R3KUQ5_9FIRM|nr:CLC_0170 family protein [Keratinibaculum paraultunense]QQY79901.1 hypothetical protein JL105_00780 [Keratinibaculum paraultunense]TCS88791.1 hypothetical protein EDD65_107148 [Keratinibaculum paraultunense]
MPKFVHRLKSIFDNSVLIFTVVIGVFIFLVDVSKYKKTNLTKELKIAKIISWSYMIFGITLFILFKII